MAQNTIKRFPRWHTTGEFPEYGRAYIGPAPGYRNGVCVRKRPRTNGTMHTWPLLGMTKWMYLDEALDILNCVENMSKSCEVALYRLRSIMLEKGVPDKRAIERDIDKIQFYMNGKISGGAKLADAIYNEKKEGQNE